MVMNISPDQIVDRIKLKRQLVNWRLIAVIAICMLIISMFSTNDFDRHKPLMESDYIARITIDGVITHDTAKLDLLNEIAKNKSIKGLIVKINSPGGTVVGGETLYLAMRKISDSQKPVAAVMGEIAASAGYMTAIGCDYLIARQGSLTGSIGVIAQTFEFSELAQRMGIKFKAFKSSPLKGGPIPTEPLSPEMEESMNETIKDMYNMFVSMVADRRPNIPREKLATLANGKAYTGRQAFENGLIDAIGDEDTALDWLKKVKGVDANLKVRDVDLEPQPAKWKRFFDSMATILNYVEISTKSSILSFL